MANADIEVEVAQRRHASERYRGGERGRRARHVYDVAL